MRLIVFAITTLFAALSSALPTTPVADLAKRGFINAAEAISFHEIKKLPVQNNGRIKPLDTLARELSIFINGSRSPLGLDPVQFYMGMMCYEGIEAVELIEVRSVELRKQLGFGAKARFASIQDLDQMDFVSQAKTLIKTEEKLRQLSALEKDVVETYQQYLQVKEIVSGKNFITALSFSKSSQGARQDIDLAMKYLETLRSRSSGADHLAEQLVVSVRGEPMLSGYQSKINLEVLYNQARPFLISGILYFCLGLLVIFRIGSEKNNWLKVFFLISVLIHTIGFLIRIYITGFAPVTNMYGTMLWVSFGIILLVVVLYGLYRNQFLSGLLLLVSGLILLLTESVPLILNPGMDPVVAVLRTNYWLTLHVLTVTLSYAAFTVCMIIGNAAMIRTVFGSVTEEFYKTYAHYAYRMAQLGVFLITAGIVLGGIWADYSWGRFWGWDPKETWALIADLGFIIILHCRYGGWLKPFGVLVAMPVAYLFVIMAWYGVNFILAAGLHSYGFSAGGTNSVLIFLAMQFLVLEAAILARKKVIQRSSLGISGP